MRQLSRGSTPRAPLMKTCGVTEPGQALLPAPHSSTGAAAVTFEITGRHAHGRGAGQRGHGAGGLFARGPQPLPARFLAQGLKKTNSSRTPDRQEKINRKAGPRHAHTARACIIGQLKISAVTFSRNQSRVEYQKY
ncbi:hypothetical protein [Azohydromonas lata]|uniref:Uncharacterized protein n=1 Tax=Azohydromonas lata TaxID=45677 RepID=A0ABU5ICB9_9BURK|nr:hypothetical protein [Azohydromonas lata]MDZ5456185.1 hypothetical protein [Azohydromonas lata]